MIDLRLDYVTMCIKTPLIGRSFGLRADNMLTMEIAIAGL
jgi:hypothetical protein